MHYLPALIALAGIHLIAVASPGPAFVATVQLSVRQSRRIAVIHSVGLGLAAATWALGAILGLQALMLHVVWLYRTLQFAGGLYLIFAGFQSWLNAGGELALKNPAAGILGELQAFRRGFATNIANPKVMVFFASIFAALLDPRWPVSVRLVVITVVAVDETGWYTALALLLSTARAQSAYGRAKAPIDRVAGSCMMFFGGTLLWSAARRTA